MYSSSGSSGTDSTLHNTSCWAVVSAASQKEDPGHESHWGFCVKFACTHRVCVDRTC